MYCCPLYDHTGNLSDKSVYIVFSLASANAKKQHILQVALASWGGNISLSGGGISA